MDHTGMPLPPPPSGGTNRKGYIHPSLAEDLFSALSLGGNSPGFFPSQGREEADKQAGKPEGASHRRSSK